MPAAWAQEAPPPKELVQFRLVFTSRMFTEVHESDAKAAVKAWGEAFARERRMQVKPDPQIVAGLPALARALETGTLDLFCFTADEYVDLGANPERGPILAGLAGGEPKVEYLLLVHQDSGIQDLAGLKDRTLIVYEHSRTCLALLWLDTILLGGKLPPTNSYFARVSLVTKLSGTVLPVFFRQADACVVTRDALETMTELNPQVGNQLRILAASPKLLPSLSYVRTRKGVEVDFDLAKEVTSLHMTAAGRQILNIFHVDRLVSMPASEIDGARQLLATHRRLMANWESVGAKGRPSKPAPRTAVQARASTAAPGASGQ